MQSFSTVCLHVERKGRFHRECDLHAVDFNGLNCLPNSSFIKDLQAQLLANDPTDFLGGHRSPVGASRPLSGEAGVNGKYTPKAGLDFLSEACGITASAGLGREQQWGVRSVQYLNDALDFGTVFPTTPAVSTVDGLARFDGVLEAFKSHQQKRHGASASTLYSYDKHIGKFLLYLEHQNMTDLSCITAGDGHLLRFAGAFHLYRAQIHITPRSSTCG